MRKIILSVHVTLDGFIDHTEVIMDDDSWKYINRLVNVVDSVLFGRVTYQLFENYWPTMAKSASATSNEVKFARWIDKIPKIVVSNTLPEVTWQHTTLIRENVIPQILKIKQQPGKDIAILGGTAMISTLMDHNLIDEYRFLIQPLVLGSGKPLFTGLKDGHKLTLIKTKTLSSGVVILYYKST